MQIKKKLWIHFRQAGNFLSLAITRFSRGNLICYSPFDYLDIFYKAKQEVLGKSNRLLSFHYRVI
jgi:hypothetical protein